MVRHRRLSSFLLVLGILLAVVTAAAKLHHPLPAKLPLMREQFEPRLAGLDSVKKLMLVLERAQPKATSLQRLDAADELLRRRFIHSYSYFRFNQNWVAAALGLFWNDLASPVRPDDILRFRRAACSQQSIVFQEIANQLGFEYATVSVPSHFMSAAKIHGEWWVFDANKEARVRRYPLAWLVSGDSRMDELYAAGYGKVLRSRSGKVFLRDINHNPAPQATLLHQVTAFISRYGWIAVLAFWGLLRLSTYFSLTTKPELGFQAEHATS